MRKHIFLLFLSFSFTGLFGQDLHEKTLWQGQLGQVRIILKIFPDSLTGTQKAVFDSPDQHASNLPVSEFLVTNDSLVAISKVIGGGFSGKFNETKTEITGHWKQGAANLPLTLNRITSLAPVVERPQTPTPPFPYKSENIKYSNANKSVDFGGTLTWPDSELPVPVVILISGSGQQDRDETIFNHKPFAVIADHLTRNGIAVLRVDDRGVGETTGEVKSATSADFAKDVLAGITYLKSRKEIDSKQIGLVGHSEGGIIAPLVANQSKDVAFIVSMAGVGVKGVDVMKMQTADMLKASNLPPDQYQALKGFYSRMLDLLKHQDINKPVDMKVELEKWKLSQPKALIDSMKLNKGQEGDEKIRSFVNMISIPWMRYFIAYNPETVLSKVKIPVLAINGAKDIQVSSTENLAGFERLLKKAGNKDFKTQELLGLNHLFQTAVTGYGNEYGTIEETISPTALQVISEWIIQHTKK